jgi:uncharacterized protein (TIGR00255 family)
MIISMTGFGRGEASAHGVTAMVELKTLNSRYLDVSVRLPQQFQDKELQFKEVLAQHISRGKINVSMYLDDKEFQRQAPVVDAQKLANYVQILREIQTTIGLEGPLELNQLLNFNDLITQPEPVQDPEHDKLCWSLIQQANAIAIEKLMDMKRQEGAQLEADISSRISGIQEAIIHIQQTTDGRTEDLKKRLQERISTLLDDEKIDADRLEMEVALMADKMDITEETVRLAAHLKFFMEAIHSEEHAGRRLNFLTQEINRELNTIGSKANDSGIAHEVVKAKEMLEQIREQVQNIE